MKGEQLGQALADARPHATRVARRFRGVDSDDAASDGTLRLFVSGSADDETFADVSRRLAVFTRNVAIDEQRRRRAPGGGDRAVELTDEHHPMCTPHEDLDEAEDSAVRAAEVLEHLAELDPVARAIVHDVIAGLTSAQIADRYGIAPSAVRVRLWRARQRLREIVGS